ncbi:MAG: ATP synthase subunit I [Blautia sp.]|nr:ATP synthase subunit I [Blautia sp.]
MGSFLDKLAPAVRKETVHVALSTTVGVALLILIFVLGHFFLPDRIPFDYTVVLGAAVGGFVAVLNFFLMALTVQKVASTQDEQLARGYMKASYGQRTLMQLIWVVAAIAAPCFHFVAGIVPLLFPGAGIKIRGIFRPVR